MVVGCLSLPLSCCCYLPRAPLLSRGREAPGAVRERGAAGVAVERSGAGDADGP